MAELQLVTEFDKLPREIRGWLASDTVAELVAQWNRSFGFTGDQEFAIPCVVTWITLGDIKPENCIPSLIDDFGISYANAHAIAQELNDKVFATVKLAMRTKLGIDVEKITQPPAPKPPVAQTMTTAKPLMADIRKAPVVPPQNLPQQPTIKAQTTVLEKPFTPAQLEQKLASSSSSQQPKPKNLSGETGTVELKKPFGFVEVQPKPPTPQDVVVYRDEHPAIKS